MLALSAFVAIGGTRVVAYATEAASGTIEDESEIVESEDATKGVQAGKVQISSSNFSDQYLREYLAKEFDKDGDGYLVVEDVTYLNLHNTYVSSYNGIELLSSVKTLTMDYKFSAWVVGGNIIKLPDSVENITVYASEYSEATWGTVALSYFDWIALDYFDENEKGNGTYISHKEDDTGRVTSVDFKPTYVKTTGDSYMPSAYCYDVPFSNETNYKMNFMLENYVEIDDNEMVDNNEAIFPDSEFRRFLSETYDSDKDGKIKVSEVNSINLEGKYKVENFAGIEKFKALGHFSFDYHGIKNCKLTDKVRYVYVYCDTTNGTLDLSGLEWRGLELVTGETGSSGKLESYDNKKLKFVPSFIEMTKIGYMPSAYVFDVVDTWGSTNSIRQYMGIYAKEYSCETNVIYHTHIQSYGDSQGTKKNGEMAGTSGEAKRLENIWIDIEGNDNLGVQYSTHCQSYGWMPWSCDGETNGTSGEAKRLEAIKIQLTGADKDKYDIYYRVHAQSYGWLGWAKNGEPSGTAGYAKRLEGIQVVVVKKGEAGPALNFAGVDGSSSKYSNQAYVDKNNAAIVIPGDVNAPIVSYKTHVQSFGWQKWVHNGAMSGTSGQAKRLEGINIKVTNCPYDGDIVYTTHVQTYGWQGKPDDATRTGWKKNGEMSGTSGEAKRLEAICIDLTGEMGEKYDVYYRVHAQSFGWLGWAKNGEESGTAGYAKRLEGIQIVLVPKGGAAPGNDFGGVTSVRTEGYIAK